MNLRYSNALEWTKPFSNDKVNRLLSCLANHADKNGVAYVGYETLMRTCGTGDRKLISAILKELKKLKIITCKRRMNLCTRYTLLMEGILEHSLPGHPVPPHRGTSGPTTPQEREGTSGNTASQFGTPTLSLENNNITTENLAQKKRAK